MTTIETLFRKGLTPLMSPPIELMTVESGQPPRAAEAGFVWRLLPDGRWYEKKRKRKQQSKHKAEVSSSSSIHPTLEPKDGERGRRRRKQRPESPAPHDPVYGHSPMGSISSASRPLFASRSNTNERERSGLYRRSMQFFKELRRSSASHSKVEPALSDTESTKSKTRELLENTSNLLRISIMQDGGFLARRSAPSTPTSTPSFESSSSRKRQNNNVPHPNGKTMSKSSSVLDILMGKPPVTTPVDDAWYTASDQVDYFKVEISEPDGPTFLPSEAIRLSTPPLPSDRPRKGNLRGFFFDYGSPGDTPFIPSSDSSQTAVPGNVSRADTLGSGEWLPFRFNPDMGMNQPFELNVPEHLLGSPLCPRSPLHPSGGKGICVYHGRTRTFSIPK